jgi:hypothetical protein
MSKKEKTQEKGKHPEKTAIRRALTALKDVSRARYWRFALGDALILALLLTLFLLFAKYTLSQMPGIMQTTPQAKEVFDIIQTQNVPQDTATLTRISQSVLAVKAAAHVLVVKLVSAYLLAAILFATIGGAIRYFSWKPYLAHTSHQKCLLKFVGINIIWSFSWALLFFLLFIAQSNPMIKLVAILCVIFSIRLTNVFHIAVLSKKRFLNIAKEFWRLNINIRAVIHALSTPLALVIAILLSYLAMRAVPPPILIVLLLLPMYTAMSKIVLFELTTTIEAENVNRGAGPC